MTDKSQILYEELLKIVEPRLLSDMCGINDDGEFDIVLALKEILAEKEQECEELRNLFQESEVRVALTDVRTGEREVWRKLGCKAQKYKQALDEIEKYINYGSGYYIPHGAVEIIRNIVNKAKRGEE